MTSSFSIEKDKPANSDKHC